MNRIPTYEHTRQRKRATHGDQAKKAVDPYFTFGQLEAEGANFETDVRNALKGGSFLTEDVTQNDLSKMAPAQLEGRLAYYERSYTFERSPRLRADFKREVERTRIELNRRKMYLRAEADRVFEL